MLSCALFVCEGVEHLLPLTALHEFLFCLKMIKLLHTKFRFNKMIGKERFEPFDFFVASGSEVIPNYNKNENPLTYVANGENVVRFLFKPAKR
jgi:hypothetical protein